jgi:hypothetical protein
MTIGDSQQTFTTFKPNQLQAGQNVQISIEDAEGEEGWSGEVSLVSPWHQIMRRSSQNF